MAVGLREALFQWFVDIRYSLKARLPQKTVLAQSRVLAQVAAAEAIKRDLVPKLPKLTRHWIMGWKNEYNVSLRKPTKKYHKSRSAIKRRLKIFWCNLIKVRRFGIKTLGVDIGMSVENVDEKGWHVNQAGSKNKGSLDIIGAPLVGLKENHAATRDRLSFMTWCSNNPQRVAEGLPLEALFKLKGSGGRVLPGLNVPAGMSVRVSDSGSYREEHVFLCLHAHLAEATDARRVANDWRILGLDIYSGHLSVRIFQLCWDRMYLLMFHGGGCTGLTQPNDTWLHWIFEGQMMDLEVEDSMIELQVRPDSVPTPSRQQILNNANAVWRNGIDHNRSVRACQRVGFSLALDGSEAQPTTLQYCRVLHCTVLTAPYCTAQNTIRRRRRRRCRRRFRVRRTTQCCTVQ